MSSQQRRWRPEGEEEGCEAVQAPVSLDQVQSSYWGKDCEYRWQNGRIQARRRGARIGPKARREWAIASNFAHSRVTSLAVQAQFRMPLCIPRLVQPADWVTVKQDAHFIIQKQVGKLHPAASGSIRARKPLSASNLHDSGSKSHGAYRILMRCNKLCLGEFHDRNDLLNQWRFLHPADADLAFDATGQDSMQRLWQSQMESLQHRASEQTEQDFVRTLSMGHSPHFSSSPPILRFHPPACLSNAISTLFWYFTLRNLETCLP